MAFNENELAFLDTCDEVFEEKKKQNREMRNYIKSIGENLGIDENSVKRLINERRDENNLNQNNDFENIMDKMDLDKARAFLKECGENIISLRDVKSKAKNMAKTLILNYSV